MKLYSTDGATAVDDPELGVFPADEHGAIDVPVELYERLHGQHLAGRKLWESESERHDRLEAEELARRKDPATLLAAVEQLGAPRQLTADELREAEEERKRIKAEREAEDNAAAVRAAAERGIKIGDIAHVTTGGPVLQGIVTEIYASTVDGRAFAVLDTGDTGPLDDLAAGPAPTAPTAPTDDGASSSTPEIVKPASKPASTRTKPASKPKPVSPSA